MDSIAREFFKDIKMNWSTQHNPDYDIVVGVISKNLFVTYTRRVTGIYAGLEQMEYYRGENYCKDSKIKSYSKIYHTWDIPRKYQDYFELLKAYYNKHKHEKPAK
jgi:hypothetical protein